MVSFELGKKIEKDVFSSCHERKREKIFRVPMRNRTSDLRIPRSDAVTLCPTLVISRKISSLST